jgi:hypothetical protein
MTVGFDPKTADIGAGTLYVAPIGTAEPTTITSPWNVAFVALGYTESGHIFTSGLTVTPIIPAEAYFPLTNIVTAKDSKVAFALMQMTAANLQTAFNGGTITTLGGGGGVTYDPPAIGTEVRCMLGWQSDDLTERLIFRQCFNTDPSAMSRVKTAAVTIPVGFDLELPGGGLQPWRWFATAARSGS